eukprot:CAMPEP_0170522974 /NCGR_PEP_ID=MMETSP0209-20121228/8359_1 /TAXON_ID=665100 ORGANISM="Litonotus pictus, Strain P1" /NCGR_SAMPLE_ID=MMETSP0209 /ASSEMBLY_ACC=CAM_ASM_000301 /LENGTH=546 /DNA_ID=CAMNT_0010810749 /DNA_START=1 /DNA_END=1638 /DNA_ORIENTATION=+
MIQLEIIIYSSKKNQGKAKSTSSSQELKMKIVKKSTLLKVDKSIIDKNRFLSNLISIKKKSEASKDSPNSKPNNNIKQQEIYRLEFNRDNYSFEMKHILDCFEYFVDSNFTLNINQINAIPYLNAFTVFNVIDLQKVALEKLFFNLNNENVVLFVKYIDNLNENIILRENCELFCQQLLSQENKEKKNEPKDTALQLYCMDNLTKYAFWLVNYLVVKTFDVSVYDSNLMELSFFVNNPNYLKHGGESELKIFSRKFSEIVKLDRSFSTNIEFSGDNLVYKKSKKEELLGEAQQGNSYAFEDSSSLYASLKFLSIYNKNLTKKNLSYFTENNYFNTGKIHRRKSEEGIIHDYPHYFQMVLDNDPDLDLFAVRLSENGNFLLSRNIENFNKFSEDYVGEVEANFWGTQFDIYDNGVEKSLFDKLNPYVFNERRLLGKIIYETNIMGECPRYFNSELFTGQQGEIQKHCLKNLEPEWNAKLNCYCLNFYGRVKKASARNFQMIYPNETDDILLQHGKENSNEFNIDFREPFNYVTAFAHSLVSIGSKRV